MRMPKTKTRDALLPACKQSLLTCTFVYPCMQAGSQAAHLPNAVGCHKTNDIASRSHPSSLEQQPGFSLVLRERSAPARKKTKRARTTLGALAAICLSML